jgi:spermidine synthase
MARGDLGAVARPVVAVEAGRKVLRVGGVIQSVAVDETYQRDVWDAMLPERPPANALILGLGGGTIATLLTQRWGCLPITGVERDPAVVFLAQHEFGLDRLPNVRIEVADAFAYLRECATRYDVLCVDLYTAGKLAHGVLAGPFLRDVARCLTPEGTAIFNFWRGPYLSDQLRRVGRALEVTRTLEVDENILAHCRRFDHEE